VVSARQRKSIFTENKNIRSPINQSNQVNFKRKTSISMTDDRGITNVGTQKKIFMGKPPLSSIRIAPQSFLS
jgi:hypothetical protein